MYEISEVVINFIQICKKNTTNGCTLAKKIFSFLLQLKLTNALHRFHQSVSKKLSFVVDATEDGLESLFDIAAELVLDCLLERVACHGFVLLEDESQLAVVSLAQNGVEDGFVGAEHQLASTEKRSCVGLGLVDVSRSRLVTIGAAQRDEQTFEVAGRVANNHVFQILAINAIVMLLDGLDLVIRQSAEDFNQTILISANASKRIVDLLAVKVQDRRQKRHQKVLKVPARLRLDIFDQILAEVGLEHFLDVLSLLVVPLADDFDQSVVVATEALHGFAQVGRIDLWIEILVWKNRWRSLKRKVRA